MTRSTLRFLLIVVALLLSGYSVSIKAQEEDVDTDFLYACSGGKVDEVKAFLQKHQGTLRIVE
jgi:outer membrane biogenesis lipoprotein LolB